MPCTEAKARHLFKSGRAKPKRNRLGLFYVQLTYCQEPQNQQLVVGVDPGSKFEGFSGVGAQDTVLNLMVEASDHVKAAIATRRTMRLKILPLEAVVVEDVQATTRPGKRGKWNTSFSPVQVGKHHLYQLLQAMGLALHTPAGWQTKELREQFGLTKTQSKSRQSFDSHAVDAWVMAASVSGAEKPTCTQLWYVVPAVLHRRQLHRLQASKGGERKPYGGTRSLGLKRGTLVRHAKYGLCTVGGFDRKRRTISLHAYRANKRLTQGASVKDCSLLTWMAWRSWLVRERPQKSKGKGTTQPRPHIRRGHSSPSSNAGVSWPD